MKLGKKKKIRKKETRKERKKKKHLPKHARTAYLEVDECPFVFFLDNFVSFWVDFKGYHLVD